MKFSIAATFTSSVLSAIQRQMKSKWKQTLIETQNTRAKDEQLFPVRCYIHTHTLTYRPILHAYIYTYIRTYMRYFVSRTLNCHLFKCLDFIAQLLIIKTKINWCPWFMQLQKFMTSKTINISTSSYYS
jgi:hypothetical protein